jgi:transcriptional regulator with AAA-type ATPase domain
LSSTDPDHTLTSLLAPRQDAPRLLALTILWHPDAERIGEQFIAPSAEVAVGRFAPPFAAPAGAALPLGHRCVAREPLRLHCRPDGQVALAPPASRMHLAVDGAAVGAPLLLAAARLDAGVVLGLGGAVLLCLHWMDRLPDGADMPALLGVSSAAIRLRGQIRQAAATDLPVLLLGETGSGKEVAARAIHAAGARRAEPMVAVNMATLNEALAAADLFGAEKGAYTGALAARPGWFAEAGAGTLFLDEIGNAPAPIQPMLLRVLESGEYRPLGARRDARSQARLIAATDQDLAAGGFNQPLLRRLEGFVIRLPPLRERRADIGLLIRQVLRGWAARGGAAAPALPAAFVDQLCRHDWPGNVRQLAGAVQRALLDVDAGLAPRLDAPAAPPAPGPAGAAPAARARLAELSPQAVLDALQHNGWRIRAAALALGVSRPSMYKLIDAHPDIRSLAAIAPEEIDAALARHGPDALRCAAALRTPSEPLRRHLRRRGGPA